jgi:hypothetical protein
MAIHQQTRTGVSSPQVDTRKILTEILDKLEDLHLLEVMYGYITDEGCKITAISNYLTPEEYDVIWDVKWDYMERYAGLYVDIWLIERQDRPLTALFQDDGTATIKRERHTV